MNETLGWIWIHLGVAWSPRFFGLFFIPVGAAMLSTGLITWEMLT